MSVLHNAGMFVHQLDGCWQTGLPASCPITKEKFHKSHQNRLNNSCY